MESILKNRMTAIPSIKSPARFQVQELDSREWWGYTLRHLRILHPRAVTHNPALDQSLANYDVYLAYPPRAGNIPVVLSLQGIGAPIQYSFFQIKPVLDMGIAWVGLDAPFGGSRSITGGKPVALAHIQQRLKLAGVRSFDYGIYFDLVVQDLHNLIERVLPRYGQIDPTRIGLIGISFGVMLASYAFINQLLGHRLVGLIGHGNIFHLGARNPLYRAHEVQFPRRYHLMLGEDDPFISKELAQQLVDRMPAGSLEIAPGVTHGGGRFDDASIQVIQHQFEDWV